VDTNIGSGLNAQVFVTALVLLAVLGDCPPPLMASEPTYGDELAKVIREQFVKYEYRIPMRDGVKLYTVAYVPRDRSRTWPIMLTRTPYGVSYGVDNSPDVRTQRQASRFAPSMAMVKDGYILVHQDVRGKMMSEGQFVDIRPRLLNGKGPDEATDAWDTIDFLVKNVPYNSKKVGIWGVSYPGFYAAQAAIDAHPALVAVSPQAPVTEWFLGDDFHHNGALFLMDAFDFYSNFGKARPAPVRTVSWDFDHDTGDLYEFFLNLGPIANANTKYFKGQIGFWNDILAHPNRDEWWKARDPRPHYRAVKPAVLTVGGLFDAEDLWGALATYKAFDTQSPGSDVRLVLGPWRHGGWSRTDGDKLGDTRLRRPERVGGLGVRDRHQRVRKIRRLAAEGREAGEALLRGERRALDQTGDGQCRRVALRPEKTSPVHRSLVHGQRR